MSPLHGEFEQLLLACSEGCGLHHNSIGSKFGAAFICACTLYYVHVTEHAISSVQPHYPMIVTSNILVV